MIATLLKIGFLICLEKPKDFAIRGQHPLSRSFQEAPWRPGSRNTVHCSCPHSQGVDVYSYLSLCFLMLSSGTPQKREFASFVVQFLAEKKEK